MKKNLNSKLTGNMRIILLATAIWLALSLNLQGQNQLEAAKKLASKCGFAQIGHDSTGHVTGLFFSDKDAYKETAGWLGDFVIEVKNPDGQPQLYDKDVTEILEFSNLKFLKFEGQCISYEGYKLLVSLKKLEYLGLHSIDNKKVIAEKIEYDAKSILLIHQMPNLKRFDYKHNFQIKNAPIGQLKGTEKIEFLMLDNSCATDDAIPFITSCPNLKVLQLHRTRITRNGLEKIVAANKKIEDLRLRPVGGDGMLLPSDLIVLENLPTLKSLSIGGNYNVLEFNFNSHLKWIPGLPNLKEVVAPIRKSGDSAFQQLSETGKNIKISFSYY